MTTERLIITIATQDKEFSVTFRPQDDPIFSHVNWVSDNKDIVVSPTMLGGWMAYHWPRGQRTYTWKRLRFWRFQTKEVAAMMGCLKWCKSSPLSGDVS